MPRVSDAEKQKSHARIIEAAAALFREKGIETTSVAEVMKAAGMTHGGFYRHFDDKDALVRAAFASAVDKAVSDLEAGGDGARDAYIAQYLSLAHAQNRKIGCPIAALGADVARDDGQVRDEAAIAVDRVANLLGDGDDVSSGYQRLALLVGAITLARLVDDRTKMEDILDAASSYINNA